MKSEDINLNGDYLEVPTFKSILRGKTESSGIIKSISTHNTSSLVYIDVTFATANNDIKTYNEFPQFLHIDLIIFQNYYTSSILITQQNSIGVSETIFEMKLMPSPYFEEGSQSIFIINSSNFKSTYLNGKPIRINLFQPSDMWNTFEIRNLKAYCSKAGLRNKDLSLSDKESLSSLPQSINLSDVIKNDFQKIINTLKVQNESIEYPTDFQPINSHNFKRNGKKKDKKKN